MLFKSLVELEGSQFPEHSIDSTHGPDGTARELLVANAPVEEETLGAFKIGHNVDVDLLKAEMDSLVEKYSGYVEC